MITKKFSLFMFMGVLALCLFSARVSAFEYPLGDLGLPRDYNQTLRDFTSEVPNLRLFVEQLPASWNWMSQGMVTPAKDQGSCGSCWAFAAVGTLESKILIANGGTWDLSEQQQVSCNTSQYGCDGGFLNALQYWEPHGPMEESCTGYSSYDGSSVACSTISSCPVLSTRTTGYYTVTMTVDSVKTSLYNDGPGSFRFDVYGDFYEHWNYGTSGQVYKQQSGSYRGGHAVLLIGWDDSKQAWLLKNSWGETGGPQGNGTFWMAYSGHSSNLNFGLANILITGPPTSVPVLNSPTATAIGSTSATIGATITYNGGASITAAGVAYGASANPDVSGTKVTSTATSGAFTVNVTGLTSNTLYHFRGYATNTVGTGYTADSTFTTLANAPAATGATSITTSGFTANWTAPSGTATISGYRLDVATDSGFTSLVSGYNNLSVSGTSQAVSGLSSGTPYYYRVRAVNAGGTSANSNTIHPMAAFISGPSTTSTKSGPVTYTVTYSSADTITLAAGNVTVNKTGTASGSVAVSGSGNTRTVTISSISGDGTLGISIAAGTASDSAGNTAPAAGPSTTFTVDNTAPTISIGSPSATSTKSGPITYTVTYGGADTITLAAGNVTLNKTGTASGSVGVSGSGNTRTVTISGISGDGTLGISIAAGTASDNAGNSAPVAGPSTTFTVDNTAPTISIGSPSATSTKSGPVTYTVTYGGADTISLAAGNITLNKTSTASGSVAVSGSGNTRTVTISGISGDGTLGISIAAGTASDNAGNTAPATGPSTTFTVDNTAPTISIGSPSATSTRSGPITYTVTYGGADTITLAAGNVTLNKTGTASGSVGVSGSGNTRTVTISGISGDGTLGISIAAGTASDNAGNTAPAAGPSTTFTVDNTAPTISIGSPSATSTRSGPITYTVTYGGVDTITLATGNVTLNKTGTASGSVAVSGTGNTRTVTISSISGDGTLGIGIAAVTASDSAGNTAPAAGPSTTFTVDNSAPTTSIGSPSATSTKSGPVTYTVTYGGADTITLAAGNVTLNKTGTASGSVAVTGSGNTTRTVTISTISGDGTLGIGIAAGTATDQAGNSAPAAGPSATFDVDNTAPTISISAPSATSTRSCAVAYGVTYSGADTVSLEARNITLNKTGTANGSIAVTGSGRTYKVTIDGISGDGTLGIGIAAGTATDQAGNSAPAAGPSATFIVDHTLPAPCKDISPLLLLLSD